MVAPSPPPPASQASMAYRLDPELVERCARLLDAPPTLATKRRLAIVDDLIAGRSPARHVELRTPCSEEPGRHGGRRRAPPLSSM